MSTQSLSTLLKQSSIEDHDQLLRAANTELKQNKSNLEAQQVKVVALLKLDRWDDAIKTIEDGGDKLKEVARLEYAYALYKNGKAAEAAEVTRSGGDGDAERGLRHVEAQASYRTENFERAAQIYRQLVGEAEDDAEADLRINSGAVDAQLEWCGQGDAVTKKKPGREDLEAFETAYNAACGCIARGEMGQGEVLLRRARDLCNSLEDLCEEDKQVELLPIAVQQIYVLTRLGKTEEAERLAQSIETSKIPDRSTRHIAQVNAAIATSKSTSNPFLAQRLVATNFDSLKPDHPFTFQSSILHANISASALLCQKFTGTATSTSYALNRIPHPTTDALANTQAVLHAAALARNSTGKEALKAILPALQKRPGNIGLALTVVQLYMLTNNPGSAITTLETLFNHLESSDREEDRHTRFSPGLVGTTVSLYTSQSRRADAAVELAKAATYWRKQTKDRPAGVKQLLRSAGGALADSAVPEHRQLAGVVFAELVEGDPSDRYSAAGVVAASPDAATSEQMESLTPISKLVGDIDAEALEDAGLAQPPSTATPSVTIRKRPAEDSKPRKAKKIRPSRMPKDYDAAKTPDPERWLPLRDRSTYRPKGKKGKARANLLSQGAAPAEGSDGSRPGTPGGEVVKAKGQPGGGGGAKKKGKAKGKR